MKKVRARARARALHQLIQQPEYRAISAPSLAGLGWVWAELSNLGQLSLQLDWAWLGWAGLDWPGVQLS